MPKYPLVMQILAAGGGAFEVVPDDAPDEPVAPGFPARKVPSVAEKQQFIEDQVQQWLDRAAQDNGYDNIFTAATYDADPDPGFAQQGKKYKALRSRTWKKIQQIQTDYLSGTIQEPKWLADIKPQLETIRTSVGI